MIFLHSDFELNLLIIILHALNVTLVGGSVPVCLLTSEPSTTGITVPIDRFQQSGGGDLLRVKYEMSKHGSSKSSDGFQPFSNDVPPQILLRVQQPSSGGGS